MSNPTEHDRPEKTTEEKLREAAVGEVTRLNSSIDIVEYNPAWPTLFERELLRIGTALQEKALSIEHVGSTSVPGLSAKPKIDILLVVIETGEESSYVPDLEAAGYVLRVREPNWYQHRMFKGPDTAINLHCFSNGCPEIQRMLQFRDRLRTNEADRLLYEKTKHELAAKTWEYTQDYADAKTAVVEDILTRAI